MAVCSRVLSARISDPPKFQNTKVSIGRSPLLGDPSGEALNIDWPGARFPLAPGFRFSRQRKDGANYPRGEWWI